MVIGRQAARSATVPDGQHERSDVLDREMRPGEQGRRPGRRCSGARWAGWGRRRWPVAASRCPTSRPGRRAASGTPSRGPRQHVEGLVNSVGGLGADLTTRSRRRASGRTRRAGWRSARSALEAVVRVVGQEAQSGGEHDGLVARAGGDPPDGGVDLRVVPPAPGGLRSPRWPLPSVSV